MILASHLLAGVLALGSPLIAHEVSEERGLRSEATEDGGLRLTAGEPDVNHDYAWVTTREFAEDSPADLSSFAGVAVTIENRSPFPVRTMFWVCGTRGWSAVGDFKTLSAGESGRFVVDLQETFPDGTPKIDPGAVG